jgi:hypothetical protein
VESKGRYKEVNLNGIGGEFNVEFERTQVLPTSHCGQWSKLLVPIANHGDVTLHARIVTAEAEGGESHAYGVLVNEDCLDSANLQDNDFQSSQHNKDALVIEEVCEEEGEEEGKLEGGGLGGEATNPALSWSHIAVRDNAYVVRTRLQEVTNPKAKAKPKRKAKQIPEEQLPYQAVVHVPPRTTETLEIDVFVPRMHAGSFTLPLQLQCHEGTFPLTLSGSGIFIEVSEFAQALMQSAHGQSLSRTLEVPYPLGRAVDADEDVPAVDIDVMSSVEHAVAATLNSMVDVLAAPQLPGGTGFSRAIEHPVQLASLVPRRALTKIVAPKRQNFFSDDDGEESNSSNSNSNSNSNSSDSKQQIQQLGQQQQQQIKDDVPLVLRSISLLAPVHRTLPSHSDTAALVTRLDPRLNPDLHIQEVLKLQEQGLDFDLHPLLKRPALLVYEDE